MTRVLPAALCRRIAFAIFILQFQLSNASEAEFPDDLGLSELEALMNIDVVSANKFKQSLSEVPAAIRVITAEDIERSNARSIPEALRLAPGVQVTRLTGNAWVVSARGWHTHYSNKLLVMIDGRSIYSPLFSGVFWDSIDMQMADIERIEVIKGPGSTVWGANAVNGVVNIITKAPESVLGINATAKIDSEGYRQLDLRVAREFEGSLFAKAWLSFKQTAQGEYPEGQDFTDEMQSFTIGGSVKKLVGESEYRLDGHWTHQDVDDPILVPPENRTASNRLHNDSGSLTFTLQRQLQANVGITLTSYYAANDRKSDAYDVFEDLFNLELDSEIHQQQVRWNTGIGFREHRFRVVGRTTVPLDKEKVQAGVLSAYGQGEWFVSDRSTLTGGIKYERHSREKDDFTGIEWMPTLRYLHQLDDNHTFWASLSRSARVPSVAEHYGNVHIPILEPDNDRNPTPLPVQPEIRSSIGLESESVWTYELGFRGHIKDNVSYDLTLFHSQYEDVRTSRPGQLFCQRDQVPFPNCEPVGELYLPVFFANDLDVDTEGLEALLRWVINPRHSLQLGFHYIDIEQTITVEGSEEDASLLLSPEYQVFMNYDWQLSDSVSARMHVRHADETPSGQVDSYQSIDLSVGYNSEDFQISIGARDLLHDGEPESYAEARTSILTAVEIQTSFYAQLEVRF